MNLRKIKFGEVIFAGLLALALGITVYLMISRYHHGGSSNHHLAHDSSQHESDISQSSRAKSHVHSVTGAVRLESSSDTQSDVDSGQQLKSEGEQTSVVSLTDASDNIDSAAHENLTAESHDGLLSLVKRIAESENPYYFGDLAREFVLALQDSPELLDEFVLSFANQPDGIEQDIMLNLLLESALVVGEDELEQLTVEMISSGQYDHENGVYQLSRELGVRDQASRDSLLGKLPTLSEPQKISAVIDSIVPQIVSADERQSVVAEISPYLGSSDDQVRSAAVKALGSWGGQEQAPIINNALSDHAGDVRHAGAVAALRSNVRSGDVRSSLLALMNDQSEELDIRQQAFYALSNYSLEGREYEEYYQFNQEIENLSGHQH